MKQPFSVLKEDLLDEQGNIRDYHYIDKCPGWAATVRQFPELGSVGFQDNEVFKADEENDSFPHYMYKKRNPIAVLDEPFDVKAYNRLDLEGIEFHTMIEFKEPIIVE